MVVMMMMMMMMMTMIVVVVVAVVIVVIIIIPMYMSFIHHNMYEVFRVFSYTISFIRCDCYRDLSAAELVTLLGRKPPRPGFESPPIYVKAVSSIVMTS